MRPDNEPLCSVCTSWSSREAQARIARPLENSLLLKLVLDVLPSISDVRQAVHGSDLLRERNTFTWQLTARTWERTKRVPRAAHGSADRWHVPYAFNRSSTTPRPCPVKTECSFSCWRWHAWRWKEVCWRHFPRGTGSLTVGEQSSRRAKDAKGRSTAA